MLSNKKNKCTCDFCKRTDADEVRARTHHLTPNFSQTFRVKKRRRKIRKERKEIDCNILLCASSREKSQEPNWFEVFVTKLKWFFRLT